MHFDWRILLSAAALLGSASAFYIPGYSIRSYRSDEPIPLWLNKVYSDNSQLAYAYNELPFICPATRTEHGGLRSGTSKSLNIGEIIRGDRIIASDYDLVVGKDVECEFLCTKALSRSDVATARSMVEDGYVAEWIVDNLPGATSFVTVDRSDKYYSAGFKLGSTDIDPVTGRHRALLHNHITLVLRWRPAPGRAGNNGGKVIVGFEVYTKSVGDGNGQTGNSTCPRDIHHVKQPLDLFIAPNNTKLAEEYPDSRYLPESDDEDDGATLDVPYSYSVYWREDTHVEWASRWDMYFRNQEGSGALHWLAIVNALVISGLLSACCVVIYGRTIRGDVKNYNSILLEDGKQMSKRDAKKAINGAKSPRPRNEKSSMGGSLGLLGDSHLDDPLSDDEEGLDDVSGYKLLHGDVFRAPAYSGLLAPLVGSGMQLVFMTVGLLIGSCLGILNPSWRGGFVSVAVGLYVFAGIFAGYFSGRAYKTFAGVNWRKNTLLTALLFPGFLFATIFSLNILTWASGSSNALPFSTLLALLALWLLIQVPLVYVGSFIGYHRATALEHPTRTAPIARQIPGGALYSRGITAALLAGVPPFAVLFVELLVLCRSLCLDKSDYYYLYGFLAIVTAIAIITVVEVSLIATYIQLCTEDYRWWWQSFAVGASSGVWIFAYCTWYYLFKLRITGIISTLLFFAYSALGSAVWGLGAGTVAFLTAYAFVRKIYGNVKAD